MYRYTQSVFIFLSAFSFSPTVAMPRRTDEWTTKPCIFNLFRYTFQFFLSSLDVYRLPEYTKGITLYLSVKLTWVHINKNRSMEVQTWAFSAIDYPFFPAFCFIFKRCLSLSIFSSFPCLIASFLFPVPLLVPRYFLSTNFMIYRILAVLFNPLKPSDNYMHHLL
jgi:hypothetical protein